MNWETAKTTCASLDKGSQLVSLKTVQESQFVRGRLLHFDMFLELN